MEVHRRLRLARRTGREAQQRDVVATCLHRLVPHRLVQRSAIELGIVVGRAVEADHLGEEPAVLRARDQFVHQPRIAQRHRDLGLVDDLAQFAGTQHRHRVHHDGTGLRGGEPAGDHRRVVRRADQHPVARQQAVVLSECVRQPVGPVGELLVGATTTVPDQRCVVAEALFHQPIGQLDAGVEVLGIGEAVEQELWPLLGRGKVVAREGVDVRRGSQRRHGTTAVASISTLARRSTSATTCTSAIAG